MDKHTPGPWGTYLNTADDMVVRKMFPDGQEAHQIARVQSPNAIRDARLIAAAPDLLQACQTFAEWLRREDVGFAVLGHDRSTPEGESAWREWYDGNLTLCALAQKQACAAIAKATGEATC